MMEEYGFDFDEGGDGPESKETAPTKFASGGVLSPINEVKKLKSHHNNQLFDKKKI